MPNPLYSAYGQRQPIPSNGLDNILQQLQQLKATFQGDPRQKVEELLSTGQMSQADFNRLSQTANQIMSMIKR